uniref:Cytochrome P450 n=1 Tax=Phanerodontia chrysosporium TaxID=2822231 RepID=G5EJX5_PHACH|nr:cytochrome P450 [Phanerodontia chrysosporium]
MDTLLLAGLVGVVAVAAGCLAHSRRQRFPPGPKGLPLLQNLLDVPRHSPQWEAYRDWGLKYNSDIVHLRLFGVSFVIVNTADAVTELFSRRSSVYSDRLHSTMLHDYIGWEKAIVMKNYGEDWREHSRLFHQSFQPKVIQEYYPRLYEEARKLLPRLLKGDDFVASLRVMTASAILGVTFGMEVNDSNDPYVTIADRAIQSLVEAGMPGSYMVEYIPLMRYIPSWAPGGKFRRDAAEWRTLVSDMFTKPFEHIKSAIRHGVARPSIATSLLMGLDDKQDNARREHVIRNVTGTAYVGAADTTVAALRTFILAMVMHPAIQKAAQAELDRVVGRDCLPTFADREHLPYLTAIQYEVLRWRPVAPLGFPRRANADDEYHGYHIPKDAIVLGNIWAILHDPARYRDPAAFDPARWLTPDGALRADAGDAMLAFGFARRICPGRHYAVANMWINMAYMLAAFDIAPPRDAAGCAVPPAGEHTTGLLTYPKPFGAVFTPRSAAALRLIVADADD